MKLEREKELKVFQAKYNHYFLLVRKGLTFAVDQNKEERVVRKGLPKVFDLDLGKFFQKDRRLSLLGLPLELKFKPNLSISLICSKKLTGFNVQISFDVKQGSFVLGIKGKFFHYQEQEFVDLINEDLHKNKLFEWMKNYLASLTPS